MKVQGFSHVTINISDLQRSLDFYTSVLQMRLVHRGRRDAYLEGGSAWVCLQERPAYSPGTGQPLGVDHVAFFNAEQDFDAAVERLQAHQVRIVRGPVRRGVGRSVYFLDPDGTQLELHTSTLAERMTVWE